MKIAVNARARIVATEFMTEVTLTNKVIRTKSTLEQVETLSNFNHHHPFNVVTTLAEAL
jgi:hypothetical protein